MSIPCSVIRDLLPLYAEDLAGEESKALVEKHLEACADCKAALEDLQEPRPVAVAEEAVPLHLMKQLMRKHTAFWCLLAACLVAAVVFALIGRMTTTQSAPYVKGVFSFGRDEDGCLFAAVTNKAPDGVDYQVEYFHDEYGRECMAIAGYTSPLLRALCVNRSGTTLKARSDAIRYVYYCDHSRSGKLTLLSGPADYAASGGGAILPRLVLNYYLFASLALAVLFFLLALISAQKGLRPHPAAHRPGLQLLRPGPSGGQGTERHHLFPAAGSGIHPAHRPDAFRRGVLGAFPVPAAEMKKSTPVGCFFLFYNDKYSSLVPMQDSSTCTGSMPAP